MTRWTKPSCWGALVGDRGVGAGSIIEEGPGSCALLIQSVSGSGVWAVRAADCSGLMLRIENPVAA